MWHFYKLPHIQILAKKKKKKSFKYTHAGTYCSNIHAEVIIEIQKALFDSNRIQLSLLKNLGKILLRTWQDIGKILTRYCQVLGKILVRSCQDFSAGMCLYTILVNKNTWNNHLSISPTGDRMESQEFTK
jgi:hypothetical protein